MSTSQQMTLYIAARELEKALRNPQASAKLLAAQMQVLDRELRIAFRSLQQQDDAQALA